jgi:acyl dehydratase
MTDKLYFEDIRVGDRFTGDEVQVEREKILAFAMEFDDQPMHLDQAAARRMGLKDIIAPGAYIFALTAKAQRAIWHRFHMLPSGLGIQVSFLAPLYGGDSITGEMEILATRPSSKPGRGWIDSKVTFRNQTGSTAVESSAALLLTCRPAAK